MLNSTHKKENMQKNGDKDGTALQKLINNAVYGKTLENLRKRIDVKLVSNKWASKPSYISHNIFDNDLVTISKSKVTLTLNKLAYIGVCILHRIK